MVDYLDIAMGEVQHCVGRDTCFAWLGRRWAIGFWNGEILPHAQVHRHPHIAICK